MNNILWGLIALIFNPFTMTITLYMNGLIWISLDFTARPVMNLNNWSMVVVGLRQVGYVSLVIKKYKRKWGNKMTEIVDEGIMRTTVNDVVYTVFFQDDHYKIKSSDASNEVVVFKKASEVQEFLNRPYKLKLGDRNAKA